MQVRENVKKSILEQGLRKGEGGGERGGVGGKSESWGGIKARQPKTHHARAKGRIKPAHKMGSHFAFRQCPKRRFGGAD